MPLLGPPVGAGGGGASCACNKDIKVAKVEADMRNQVAECGLTTTFPVPCMDHISGWCCVI
ncbi:hypothetical protein, unlikely [Trypanosoma brucei brucei TREU927]|uniref:Uncharacterized protein n=1 Tax=Trypanosoma brucei brucei (strain 927/4 GUTat10.1) TaxID=185431 RepID=Q383F9_TRYB2|nr:hypothetical protein, unlikely [Trypanosoma brucei brucei TREU927]EAN80072.1 hypothetical protein, unlikely [Trypanosoma brucei brucei TREU927]